MIGSDRNGNFNVPENKHKLSTIPSFDAPDRVHNMVSELQQDKVVKLSGLSSKQADAAIYDLAVHLGLESDLEMHAGLADLFGHRKKLSKYYMTVNKRRDFQCITPHSEGASFQNIQLVSFYCHENSTDGGTTVLMNINEDTQDWYQLKEVSLRAKLPNRKLSTAELSEIKMRYQVELPRDQLQDTDHVLSAKPTHIPGLEICDVLAKPRKTFSTVLGRDVFAYWSSISRFDSNSIVSFRGVLKDAGLYKTPPGDPASSSYDDGFTDKKIHASGVNYGQIFNNKLTLDLKPGDFVVMNNLTWAQGVSNWTPDSGSRTIAAAMA